MFVCFLRTHHLTASSFLLHRHSAFHSYLIWKMSLFSTARNWIGSKPIRFVFPTEPKNNNNFGMIIETTWRALAVKTILRDCCARTKPKLKIKRFASSARIHSLASFFPFSNIHSFVLILIIAFFEMNKIKKKALATTATMIWMVHLNY